ncbi:MAG TPA: hypothetical protein VNM14_22660 [Planctomycetota bacterium]|nr:hypothetical protein [Planctomycetota bacterium]
MRVLLPLGMLAMLGCAASKPIPAYMLNELERPRDDFSQRTRLQDDAPGLTPEETRESDG